MKMNVDVTKIVNVMITMHVNVVKQQKIMHVIVQCVNQNAKHNVDQTVIVHVIVNRTIILYLLNVYSLFISYLLLLP